MKRYAGLVLVGLTLFLPRLASAQQFASRLDYFSLGDLSMPCVFDVNGDGIPDILNAGIGVQTFLGNGDGSFQTGVTVRYSSYTFSSLACGDLNHDGKVDLVMGAQRQPDFTEGITVLLSNGDGTFRDPVFYPAPISVLGIGQVVLTDATGDGNLDVITMIESSSLQGTIFFRGQGDGTLGSSVVSYVNGVGYPQFAVADFNKDGKMDIAVPATGGAAILMGDGTGAFTLGAIVPVSGYVAAGDVNGDGIPDLAVSSLPNVSIALSNGDGTFQTPYAIPVPTSNDLLLIADVNHDGIPDLVTTAVRVAFGLGGGQFAAAKYYPVADSPAGVAVARLRADGPVDIVYQGRYYLSVLLNQGRGRYEDGLQYNLGLPQCIAVADFNRDGKPDMAVMEAQSGTIRILLGTGRPRSPFRKGGTVNFAVSCLGTADMNGDGIPDLVATRSPNYLNTVVLVFLGNGDGTFRVPSSRYVNFLAPLAFADLNGDGKMDVITADGFYLAGNGDGTLQPPVFLLKKGQGGQDVQVGDFNGDGKPDLFFSDVGGNDYIVLLNLGGGQFQNTATPLYQPGASVVADFNGDGKLDVAVSEGGHQIALLVGQGDGTFQALTVFQNSALPGDASLVRLGDFNGDGMPDLAVDNYLNGNLALVLGNGDGTFRMGELLGTIPQGSDMAVANLQGESERLPRDILFTGGSDLLILQDVNPLGTGPGALPDETEE